MAGPLTADQELHAHAERAARAWELASREYYEVYGEQASLLYYDSILAEQARDGMLSDWQHVVRGDLAEAGVL